MLELALLGLLAQRPRHGYDLQKALAELPAIGGASFGSLYPALRRLARDGLVTATTDAAAPALEADGDDIPMTGSLGGEVAAHRARRRTTRRAPATGRRARKVYALTDAGRHRLVDLVAADGDDDPRVIALRLAYADVLGRDGRRRVLDQRSERLLLHRDDIVAAMAASDDVWHHQLHERSLRGIDAERSWITDQLSTLPQAEEATSP